MYFPKVIPFFILLLSLISYKSSAQSSILQNKRLVLKYHYGFVLNHKTEMAHLANQRPNGIELDLNISTKGKKEWQIAYSYPETGVSIQYWIMDPEKKLGNQLGIIPYIQKHIFRTRKSSLLYRIGLGAGYIEKRFDLYDNNQNNLISNRLNYVLNTNLIFNYKINSKISGNAGIALIHFSNGGYKKPNLGINIPSAFLGFSYHFEETRNIVKSPLSPYKKGLLFMIIGSLASKNEYPVGSKNFLVTTFSLYAGNKLNRKSTVITGIDYFYDSSMKVWGDSTEIKNKWNFAKAGFVIGHELQMGKLSLTTHIGYMFHCPIQVLSKTYQRYGLRYYFKDYFFITGTMKANLARADFVEFGIGYRFIK